MFPHSRGIDRLLVRAGKIAEKRSCAKG